MKLDQVINEEPSRIHLSSNRNYHKLSAKMIECLVSRVICSRLTIDAYNGN